MSTGRLCKLLWILLLVGAALPAHGREHAAKRDFRGAWIQTIYQGYDKRTSEQNQQYLNMLLDSLQRAGINAVIFQVRPRSDAFYADGLEPWSKYLTGREGRAPQPAWDPLEFMVREAHARGMELHAWLNPYRAAAADYIRHLPPSSLLKSEPERFVKYGNSYYLNPALDKNRRLVADIVADIVTRYQVDGIHFDDYFYPYPVKGAAFPDADDYAASGTDMTRADWRRHNVDRLIELVHNTIDSVAPGVRFGVSPFGIWRNAATDPKGSATRGLQNYDDLYADPLLWARKGWVDYVAPQLYWEINHRVAPYGRLVEWWARNANGRHLYIGQDFEKTLKFDELDSKLDLIEPHSDERIQGNVWWYAASVAPQACRLGDGPYRLKALVPCYPWKHVHRAGRPSEVKFSHGRLTWHADGDAAKWAVYYSPSHHIDTSNPGCLCAVVYKAEYLPQQSGHYAITALDRANGESQPSKTIKVNLNNE